MVPLKCICASYLKHCFFKTNILTAANKNQPKLEAAAFLIDGAFAIKTIIFICILCCVHCAYITTESFRLLCFAYIVERNVLNHSTYRNCT